MGMNFEEAGAALRAEREKRNLSIEDVARQLKISPRQLRALESGDLDSLPHLAYARGFIRSYASWLGLNLDNLHALEKPAEDDDAPIVMNDAARSGRGGSGWLWIFLIVILCGLVGWYAWRQNFWGLMESAQTEKTDLTQKLSRADTYLASKQEEIVSKPEGEQKSESAEIREEKNTVSAPVELPEATSAPVPARETTVPQQNETPETARQAETSNEPEKVGNAPENLAKPGNHKLIITAIEECWVHSNSDKTDTRQFSLRKGDTFALTFAETLELKLGNAGGVRLRYDGQDLPAPGTSGQVKTIVFPPASQE